jgi:hypothetical protein
MEEIIEQIESLIDDIERDGLITKDEILNSLKDIKTSAEDTHMRLDY